MLFNEQRNFKKSCPCLQNIKQYNVFINNITIINLLTTIILKEMFLEHQIRILEWLLKDHVTLKIGGMAAEIQLCITEIN